MSRINNNGFFCRRGYLYKQPVGWAMLTLFDVLGCGGWAKKPTHFTLLFALCLTLTNPTIAANNTIHITPAQIASLGITLGKLETASQVPLLVAPAKVVIPSDREYVVNVSQSGLISHLYASVGDRVTKHTLLAKLRSPDLLALQGRYLKALGAMSLANATYQRDKKLLSEGVIASRREQESLSQYNAAVLEVNESQQLLAIAGMPAKAIQQLKTNQRLNDQLMVYSPINGVVLDCMVVVGTQVNILAPLYRVADLSVLWLEIEMPHERLADVSVGERLAIEHTDVTAKVSLLGQHVDEGNQTVLVRATIEGHLDGIRPGQHVNVQLIQDSNETAFQVPDTAVAQHEGQAYVFVHTQDGFAAQPVTVVGKQAGQSTLTGNLKGDETIAHQGAAALKAIWLGLGSEE
jgi:membrane fusion protein, heavy metal efflux system